MNASLKATVCDNVLQGLKIQPNQTISKTLYQDSQLKVVLFGFAPGQELSEHTAAGPVILQFLSGEAHVSLGEESVQAVAGTFLHMPAHLPHSIAAETETRMLLLLWKDVKR